MNQSFVSLFSTLNDIRTNLEASLKELKNNKATSSTPKVGTQGHSHRRLGVEPSGAPDANGSAEDLTTWTHLCVDRKGAVMHTVHTKEDGSELHSRIGQFYPNIPRVEAPSVKISRKEVEALEKEHLLAEEARKDAEWEFV